MEGTKDTYTTKRVLTEGKFKITGQENRKQKLLQFLWEEKILRLSRLSTQELKLITFSLLSLSGTFSVSTRGGSFTAR